MKKKTGESSTDEKNLAWWQLSLYGVGCIIGTGFFLGSSIAIDMTGPSVILAFFLAACGTYIVFEALAKMSAKDPQKGSFRSYAKNAYGRWAGFSSGWVYWCSEMLIIGSQLTAISLLSKFWFPDVPLWIFALGFAVCGLLVLFIGTSGFEKLESVFAVTKVAAIFMFIVLAILALTGTIDGSSKEGGPPQSIGGFFPNGGLGFWSALLFAFYAHGGIEGMGVMAIHLRHKEEAPKSGKVMLGMLGIIYLTALSLALLLLPWTSFQQDKSPFATALASYNIDFFPHVFNGAIILAGFSTMSASLFSVTTILLTLSEEGDAPAIFSKQMKKKLKIPLPAVALTSVGLILSIVTSLLLPGKVYEYITTAAGLMLLYNWFFILIMCQKLLKLSVKDNAKRIIGMILVFSAVSGTLVHPTSRPGFFISLAFITVIGLVVLILRKKWKKEEQNHPV